MSRQSIQAGKAVIVVELTDRATMQFSKLTSGLSAQMMRASRSLRNLSTGAAGGLFATGVAVRNTMKDFISFEDQMLNLTVKLGYFGNLTQEQSSNIEGLRTTIMNLGRTTAFTSKEVADAAVSLAQAGFSVDEIKGSLKGALDFARGTGYALGDSADMLANIVRTFNMFGANDTLETRMNKITNVTSQMVKATRLGTIEIQDLRESLKYASGTAGNLGIKLPVLLGFLVQMSESGLKASLAGTSMNTALLNMIKSSDKLKTIAPNFSIATDAAGNEDLVTTMYELFKISSKMSKIEQAAFFQDIFNIRGARAVSSVQEMERVTGFIEQIQKAGAESALAAAKMEEGVGGATRRLASAFETLNITIGKVAEGKLISLFNMAAYGVTIFEEWIKQNGLLALSYLALPPILAGVMVGALTLSFALSRLALVIRGLTAAGKGLRSLGGLMGTSLVNLSKALTPGKRPPSQIAIQMAAYKKQQQKVAKLQQAVDIAMAKAQAGKTPAGAAAAMQRVAQGKRMQSLISGTTKLSEMKRQIAARQNAVTSFSALRAAAGERLQTRQETKFYKNRQKGYNLHAAQMTRQYRFQSTLAAAAQARGANPAPYAQAAAGYKQRMLASRKSASLAGGLAKKSQMTGMMQGLGVIGRAAAVSGKGILTLGIGFLKLTASITRFVFSWNFVGMIFNVLLMFGDKIPAVVNAFKALGAGISGAFGELGKVASYAGPAMNLFKLAFSAFRQGETGVGVQALQTGFMGLVDIIKNQLVAAWNTFLVHVEYVWIVLRKIFEGLKVIFMSIFEGISKTFSFMASPIMASFGDLFSGMGSGGGMAQTATMIVKGIDMFVTGFFKGLISLSETLQTFLADFQGIVGQIVSRIPGTGSAGARIQGDAAETRKLAETRGSLARGMLEFERKQRAKQLEQIMAISPQEIARRRAGTAAGANERSLQQQYSMQAQFENLNTMLETNLLNRQITMFGLQQDTKGPSDAQLAAQKQKAYNEVQTELASVRARLAEADKEQGSTDMKKLYDSLQTPEDLGELNTWISSTKDLFAKPAIADAREKAALLQREQFLLRSLFSTQNNPQQQLQQELPKFLQALTGGAMSTRAILRTDTKRQEDLLKESNALQQETNRLLSVQGGIG
jgi:TP901 family phage tail tape measure protein